MIIDHLCMGCMSTKGDVPVCPECGWKEGTPPESNQHLPPGTLLNGRHCIGKVLGQGGFGITYLALDTYLDLKLAIKEYFPRELVSRPTGQNQVSIHSENIQEQYNYALEKFLGEARTLARFEGHPNIISVRDFFKANGTAYLAMHYLEGITFKEYLELKEKALSFEEAMDIVMPILDALRAVHAEGVLHRDISPDNIFITNKGRVILLDFGAARQAIGEKGKHLSVVLKPGYAPEEQYRSRGTQGPWTDIYAVAATLYRAVTAQMPPDSLDRLKDDPLLPPSRLGVLIGSGEEAALMKALSVRAENRFQDVTLFQEALWSAPPEPAAGPSPQLKSEEAGGDMSRKGAGEETGVDSHTQWGQAASPYHPPASQDRTEEEAFPPPEKQAVLDPKDISVKASSRPEAAAEGIRVGRAPDNDFVLSEATVSRYHARLFFQSGKWYITDRGSTHGTFVNGVQVLDTCELAPGSRLQFSGITIYFDGNNLFSEQGVVLKSLTEPLPLPHSEAQREHPPGKGPLSHFSPSFSRLVLVAATGLLGLLLLVLALSTWRDGAPPAVPPEPVEEVVAAEAEVDTDDTAVTGDGEDLDYSIETGTIEYEGGIYTGELKDGVPHGQGTLVYPQPSFSTGVTLRGERKYEGEWQEGKKHGEGKMTYPEGSIRQGLWNEDVFVGR